MISNGTAAAVTANLAAALARHRDDFESDEDFLKLVDLVAVTIAPLDVSWARFVALAQRRVQSVEARQKHVARLRKRAVRNETER